MMATSSLEVLFLQHLDLYTLKHKEDGSNSHHQHIANNDLIAFISIKVRFFIICNVIEPQKLQHEWYDIKHV
jgi:hypothetical protein